MYNICNRSYSRRFLRRNPPPKKKKEMILRPFKAHLRFYIEIMNPAPSSTTTTTFTLFLYLYYKIL